MTASSTPSSAGGTSASSAHTSHSGAMPPPGCPAHAGAVRLSGDEHRTDPMGVYEQLREKHGPVAPVLVEGDLPAWLVLGYRENLEVVRTPNRFSRDSRIWNSLLQGHVPEDSPLLPMIGWRPLCVFVDGAEHERLRAAVTESLAKLDRRGIRRYVTRFAGQLIDRFVADGEADLVSKFAEHLPMLVLTQLFGMPEEYGPRLVEATLDLIKGSETAFESDVFVTETVRAHVARRREEPAHDFTSLLMAHPANLDDEEVAQHLRLILISANETTTICIGNTLHLVMTDHRFRASLAGVRMTLPDAVEQVLWDEPSIMVCPARWATGDTEIGNVQVKAGDMLLLGLAAGNTDPAVRPDLTMPMHGNRSHLAFSGGPHECPGQDIGRAITETAVDVLLTRLPDVELAVADEDLVWVSSWMSRHLTELPVRFKPGSVDDTAARNVVPSQAARPERVGAVPPPGPDAEAGGPAAAGANAVAAAPAAGAVPTAEEPPSRPRKSLGARIAGWFGIGKRR
ncbi:cytochrome P450 [Yinghuangia aomiensis]|uniref:Cytochrome P450 n=1 Tax=Yinghuangia aomiensis TaxID=676205 RepID=A0ABP9H059_9ACTN